MTAQKKTGETLTDWRGRLQGWAATPLPEGALRVALHDEELLALGAARVASQRRGRVLIVCADEGRAEQLASGVASFLRLLGDGRLVVPLSELTCGRGQWVPENEASRCAAQELALSGR